jgi:hypothetical protein
VRDVLVRVADLASSRKRVITGEYRTRRCHALTLCRLHLCATAADPNPLLTEQQKSVLSRSCPECKCGPLHVVARCSAAEPPASPSSALHCRTFADLYASRFHTATDFHLVLTPYVSNQFRTPRATH